MRRSPLLPLALAAAALAGGCGGDGGTPGQDGPVLGEGDAVLVVVTSVGCEPCARFHERTLPRIVERFVEPGDVRVRTVLLVPPDDAAARLTAGIRAAGLQDRFYDALGRAVRTPPPGEVEDLLQGVEGLDAERARRDLDGEGVAEAAAADRDLADRHGADTAPTLLAGTGEDDLRPIRAPDLSETEVAGALDDLLGR